METIVVDGISRSYNGLKAVDGVSFQVGKGEIFGVIGPDGAGKTTLFKILVTLLMPDAGKACIDGLDVVSDYRSIRRMTGYMPGRFSLYQDLSVSENLEFYATIFGTTVEENYDNIREIYSQIEPFRDRKAGALSGGMKQKLALCCALVHRPAVLFLDEPTTGVDAVSRKQFWDMLYRIRSRGVTILVSTPYMDEASLCDRITLMQHGCIYDTGTPASIVAKYPYRLLSVKGKPVYRLLQYTRNCKGVLSCFSFGSESHAAIDPSLTDDRKLAGELSAGGFRDFSVRYISPGIEDCFLQFSRESHHGS